MRERASTSGEGAEREGDPESAAGSEPPRRPWIDRPRLEAQGGEEKGQLLEGEVLSFQPDGLLPPSPGHGCGAGMPLETARSRPE